MILEPLETPLITGVSEGCKISVYIGGGKNVLFSLKHERKIYLIVINAKEKEAIIKKYPETHIHRTVKQKSGRHRYYMEESRNAMRMLRQLRQGA